jgi:hypothetical protein
MINLTDIVRATYVGIASTRDDLGRAGKRLYASCFLACMHFAALLALIEATQPDLADGLVAWINEHWHWSSDNVRSFQNPGTAFALVLWFPLLLGWLRVGRRWDSIVPQEGPGAVTQLVVLAWGMLGFVGVLFIHVGLGKPWHAVLASTALTLLGALWFVRLQQRRHAP